MSSLSGVWTATLTPLGSDLEADPDRLVEHVQRLIAEGCDGVVLFGTTGEATSFSVPERIRLLDELIAAEVEPDRVIVGVGCTAVVDTLTLTRHAAGHGVAAVLMLPPFYYKAVSDDDLAEAFGWVFRQMGRETAPVLLYNIPQVAGVGISGALAGRLLEDYPDVVRGVKDSSGDLGSLRAFLAAMPDQAVFAGTELLLVPGLDEGAVGAISAAANINARQIRRAFTSRDPDDMELLNEVRQVLSTQPLIPSLKSIVALRLDDPQWAAVRPPFRPVPRAVAAALDAALPGT